jgi:haloalkane dehalogenase
MDRNFLKNETFEGTYPFKPNFHKINGFDMHYADEGNGDPLLCLHGMPTWSYLYRKFILELSKTNRVIAPDQMGFGKTDVPLHLEYKLEQHIDNLRKLIFKLDLKNITMVFQDWGGPISLGFAVDNPERIKRLVIMNTSVGVMKENQKPWYKPMEEKGIYDDFIKNIPGLIKSGMYEKRNFTEIMKKAYQAPFPNDNYFIGALAWPKDIPVGMTHQSSEKMLQIRENLSKLKEKEKILIWGMKDPIFPPKIVGWWHKIYPEIKIFKIENAAHFLQEDAPNEIIEIIKSFIKKS